MRWGRLAIVTAVTVGLLLTGRSSLAPKAQAQTGQGSINSCQNILQNLQIAGQSVNPARVISCQEHASVFDQLQSQYFGSIITIIQFPTITSLTLTYHGAFDPNVPNSYYKCTDYSNYICHTYDWLDRYSSPAANADTWIGAASTHFDDWSLSETCADAGSTYRGKLNGQDTTFSCQSSRAFNGTDYFYRWNTFQGGFDSQTRNTDITTQYLLAFTPNLTAYLVANPEVTTTTDGSTLTWTTTGATSVSITPDLGIGTLPVNGNHLVHPAQTTTYTMIATGASGQLTQLATVHVLPTASLTANPPTTDQTNGSTLTWTTTGADRATIVPSIGLNGTFPLNGNHLVHPAQTTLYTLTAINSAGSTIARATITIIPLPDLRPDLSAVNITVSSDGHTFHTSPPAAQFGSDITSITIANIKVTNNGPGNFSGSLPYLITFYDPSVSSGSHTFEYPDQAGVTVEAGQTVVIAPITFSSDNNRINLLRDAFSNFAYDNHSDIVGFDLKVNPDKTVLENDYGNNESKIDNFLTAPVINVLVKSAGQAPNPIEGAVVTFTPSGKKSKPTPSFTNTDGKADLAPTLSLNGGPIDYTISIAIGATNFPQLDQRLHIDTSKIYDLNFSVSGLLIVAPRPKGEITVDDPPPLFWPTAGTVTISSPSSSKSQRFTSSIIDGLATFSSISNPGFGAGSYQLLDSTANVGFQLFNPISLKYQDANAQYNWPDPTRVTETGQDPKSPPMFSYDANFSQGSFQMLIHKECSTNTGNAIDCATNSGGIQYSYYDNPSDITLSKQNVLPILKREITRYQSWPSSPLHNITEINLGVNPVDNTRFDGYYSRPNTFVLETRISNLETTNNIQTLVDHEMFHALDNGYAGGSKYLTTNNSVYKSAIDQMLASDTGLKLWDVALWGECAYNSPTTCTNDSLYAGYSNRSLDDPNIDPYHEAFAESMSTVCVYKQQVVNRLANIVSYWTANQPVLGPPPSDLVSERDSFLHFLQGQDPNGQVVIPQFQQWYNDCLSS